MLHGVERRRPGRRLAQRDEPLAASFFTRVNASPETLALRVAEHGGRGRWCSGCGWWVRTGCRRSCRAARGGGTKVMRGRRRRAMDTFARTVQTLASSRPPRVHLFQSVKPSQNTLVYTVATLRNSPSRLTFESRPHSKSSPTSKQRVEAGDRGPLTSGSSRKTIADDTYCTQNVFQRRTRPNDRKGRPQYPLPQTPETLLICRQLGRLTPRGRLQMTGHNRRRITACSVQPGSSYSGLTLVHPRSRSILWYSPPEWKTTAAGDGACWWPPRYSLVRRCSCTNDGRCVAAINRTVGGRPARSVYPRWL